MADVPVIIDLPAVIEPHLNGGKLVSYTTRYLTKPGENYGSIMLALMANIEKPTGEIEEIPLVAKLPPISNELFWQIFQPERTCLTENAVYKYLSPAIRTLQLEEGVAESQLFDGFSKYYGSRISLKPEAGKVDHDAVLIQENLQTAGFKAGNRQVMFNLEQIQVVLRETAKYHALPIALRMKKPEEFKKIIMPSFTKFNMNKGLLPEVKNQLESELYQEVANATNNNRGYVDRIKEMWQLYEKFMAMPEPAQSPYNSIVHSDLWINNIMLQYDENGSPSKVKFVDFQISQYENLAHDIIFLLYSSVETQVLEEHYDELLQLYFDSFIECLKSVNASTEDFSYEGFLQQLHERGPIEICHALFMTKVILADSSHMPESYKDMDMSAASKSLGNENMRQKTADIIRLAEEHKLM